MTEVHEALKTLAPAEHAEFPRSPSSLDVSLSSHLVDVHTLIASIPPPADLPPDLTLPEPTDVDAKALQKEWKPVKMSAKDNPLNISVFKLSAKDGRGAWFARRSIHTDIPFSRFKAGLQREFDQPKKENGENCEAVRGIGKDDTVHSKQSQLGKAEIHVLSAQFPGPSAPRMFVEGYLTTSAHPEDISSTANMESGGNTEGSGEQQAMAENRPKQFTVISKPILDHPDVEERQGYVKGQYESVEFIREVITDPKHLSRSASVPNVPALSEPASPTRPRGKTVGSSNAPPTSGGQGQIPPVEWIMITRSDPGGNVPRWMVERGTPNGIVKDAEKFIKWCLETNLLDNHAEETEEETVGQTLSGQVSHRRDEVRDTTKKRLSEYRQSPSSASTIIAKDHATGQLSPSPSEAKSSYKHSSPSSPSEHPEPAGGRGIFSTLTSAATGITSLAASAISGAGGHESHPQSQQPTPPPSEPGIPTPPTTVASDLDTDLSSDSDTASISSFATARSFDPTDTFSRTNSGVPESIDSTATPTAIEDSQLAVSDQDTPESRALNQFLKEKLKLEEKLRREEAKRLEKERKTTEKHLKNLEKRERKFRRAVEKAEERKRREAEKVRRQQVKADAEFEKEGSVKSGKHGGHTHSGSSGRGDGWREVDALKRVVEELTRENLDLKKQVEALQEERMVREAREGLQQ